MIKLQDMRKAVIDYGLIASEHINDNDYIDSSFIPDKDFREILPDISDYTYLYDLSEGEVGGCWNELRLGNTILDNDAPCDLTVKAWVEYINSFTE